MILYHYTCIQHLPRILADGYLMPSESNIGSPHKHLEPYGEHVGPDVVWLTSEFNVPKGSHGLFSCDSVDKTRIRFTVNIDCPTWREFANNYNINKKWYQILDRTGNYTAKYWYVYPGQINKGAWMQITDMQELKQIQF